MVDCAPLTLAQLHGIVEQALDGPRSLDELVSQALFPSGVPEMWRDWPQQARDIWDLSVALYGEKREEEQINPLNLDGSVRHRCFRKLSLSEAWDVVEESSSWEGIARRLHVDRRAAKYQVGEKWGFTFEGRGQHRVLVRGPCDCCGSVYDLFDLAGDRGRTGPCCDPAAREAA